MRVTIRQDGFVERPAGPWSAGVAGVLHALEAAGIPDVPRHRGFVEDRELVTFVSGLVPARPYPPSTRSDTALVAAGAMLRSLHACLGAVAIPGAQRLPGAPTHEEVVCHNDPGPWNTVYRAGRPVGLIDWDLAAPGPARWDLAALAWHHVPLYADEDCPRFGWRVPPDRPRRLALLAGGYGSPVDGALLDLVALWHDVTESTVEWARQDPGRPGAQVWENVDVEGVRRDRGWLTQNRRGLLAGRA